MNPANRHLWLLDPEIVYLNHGSFGACPRRVLDEQTRLRDRLEREPVIFMVRELEEMLDAVRLRIAQLVNAPASAIAFVPNATTAVNSVLASIDFSAGDEVIVTDHEYNACRNALDHVASRTGVRVNVVTLPFEGIDADRVMEILTEAVTPKTRLLLIDHISSQTGIVFPIERICSEMNQRGIETLVDGAHGIGMVPLDLEAMQATWYTSNNHKWICAPKGSAFLYTREDRLSSTRPIVISHGANSPRTDRSRYHLEFDWTGTSDPTPWLATSEAIDFMNDLHEDGLDGVMRSNRELVLTGRDILCESLGIEPPVPDSMIGAVASVGIPDGGGAAANTSLYGDPIQDALLDEYRIEVPVVAWPAPPRRLLRISAQMYNERSDYTRLAEALGELLAREGGRA